MTLQIDPTYLAIFILVLRIFAVTMPEFSIPINWDLEATFLRRPNRFLAHIEIEDHGEDIEAHVHDPGRLREILVPGRKVLVRRARNPDRRTKWDIIAGMVDHNWVLINSSFHRRISESLLSNKDLNPFGPAVSLKPEVKIGKSRLDYQMVDVHGNVLYIEVKGCSLTKDGIALFPDAPTTRGDRHLKELIKLRSEGNRAGVLILILGPKARCFSPNFETDPRFSSTFIEAYSVGVEIHPIQFEMVGHEIVYRGRVSLCPQILSE
jgi:sugar fermentation stimulation protein A